MPDVASTQYTCLSTVFNQSIKYDFNNGWQTET